MTSTNFAPARYALSATARVSSSLPGSVEIATIWPGWTFAANPTMSSAKRSRQRRVRSRPMQRQRQRAAAPTPPSMRWPAWRRGEDDAVTWAVPV